MESISEMDLLGSLFNAMVRVLPMWITELVTAVGRFMVFLVVECAIQGYQVKPNLIFGKLCAVLF